MRKPRYWMFFPLIFAVIFLAVGWVVMTLWNAILPETVGAGALSYPKALGLLILSRILFGGFRMGGNRSHRFSKPWNQGASGLNWTDEDKARFRAEWKDRCGR